MLLNIASCFGYSCYNKESILTDDVTDSEQSAHRSLDSEVNFHLCRREQSNALACNPKTLTLPKDTATAVRSMRVAK